MWEVERRHVAQPAPSLPRLSWLDEVEPTRPFRWRDLARYIFFGPDESTTCYEPWVLGQDVTDGRRTGRVVMLIKYSLAHDGPAVRIELEPAKEGRAPVDVVVPASDASWRPL